MRARCGWFAVAWALLGSWRPALAETGLRCLTCNSDRSPSCYFPVGGSRMLLPEGDWDDSLTTETFRSLHSEVLRCVSEGIRVAVKQCESGTRSCYTQFGAHEEVERGCLVRALLGTSHSCVSKLCNSLPVDEIPLPIDNLHDWHDHLSSIKEFTKNNQDPLECVQCDSKPTEDLSEYLQDECYTMPENRVEEMATKCRRNEFCYTTVGSGGRVSRGCINTALDSSMALCTTDECNNHVDVGQETRMRQQQLDSLSNIAAPPYRCAAVLLSLSALPLMFG